MLGRHYSELIKPANERNRDELHFFCFLLYLLMVRFISRFTAPKLLLCAYWPQQSLSLHLKIAEKERSVLFSRLFPSLHLSSTHSPNEFRDCEDYHNINRGLVFVQDIRPSLPFFISLVSLKWLSTYKYWIVQCAQKSTIWNILFHFLRSNFSCLSNKKFLLVLAFSFLKNRETKLTSL